MEFQVINVTKADHEHEIRGRIGHAADLLEGVAVQTEQEAIQAVTNSLRSKQIEDVDVRNLWVSDYRGIRHIVGWEVTVEIH